MRYYKDSKVVNLINYLIYFFPLSFILGNSFINLNIILISITGFYYFLIKKIKIKYNNLIIVTFIFTIYVCIESLFNSSDIFKSLTFIRYAIFLLVVYNLFININFKLDKILYVYSLIVFIIAFDVVFQYIFKFNIVGIKPFQETMFNSFFVEEKIAGAFILNFSFFLIVSIFLFLQNKKFSKFLQTFTILLVLVSIFLSQNRMSVLLCLFGLLLFSCIYRKKFKLILISILLFFSFLYIFPENPIKIYYKNMISNILEAPLKTKIYHKYLEGDNLKGDNYEKIRKEAPESHKTKDQPYHLIGSGHVQLFVSSFTIFKENPIFGIGLKNYYKVCLSLKSEKNVSCSNHPHNYYLDILTTSGIIGFLILAILIFLILKNFINSNVYKKKKFNINDFFYILLFINFLIIFFPLRSSGSFFTTGNASFIFFTISLISYFQTKLKKS